MPRNCTYVWPEIGQFCHDKFCFSWKKNWNKPQKFENFFLIDIQHMLKLLEKELISFSVFSSFVIFSSPTVTLYHCIQLRFFFCEFYCIFTVWSFRSLFGQVFGFPLELSSSLWTPREAKNELGGAKWPRMASSQALLDLDDTLSAPISRH